MEFMNLDIDGVKLIKGNKFSDERGVFLKTFNDDFFINNGINMEIKESFYSISNKDVIRGMHYQNGDYAQDKLVYVPKGKVLDVVLDIRKSSKTFKKFITVELSEENGKILFIPKGCAHGFKVLEDDTIMVYNVSTVYSKDNDCGIRYDSFGIDWGVKDPIMSKRDKEFKPLHEIEFF